jgi:asparagine synthase (glutamine-hydrolysing)
MSGITGIFQLEGAPIDRKILGEMNDLGRHRGPDGSNSTVSGCIGLAYRHFETGHENACARQPAAHRRCLVVLDGRIDNRIAVRSALASAGRALETHADTELIVAAYEQWGAAFADRLTGEFAFGLWDATQRILLCVRDALGVKPLHYYHDSRVFVFASEIRQLLAHPEVPSEPNEGMIGEYVCHRVTSRIDTLYRNISRLPAGHCLAIGANGLKVVRYWSFPHKGGAPKKSDADYAEEFLQIFSDAIRCRIADRCQIGFDLSGGLDSSSIVSMANRIAGHDSRFQAFALAFTDPRADERQYINAVANTAGMRTNLIRPVPLDVARFQEIVARYRDYPGGATLLMHDPVLESFQDSSTRIRVTGMGGDQWLAGDLRHTADLIRQLKLWTALRQARYGSRILADLGDNTSAIGVLGRYGVVPLLPHSLRRAIKMLLRRQQVPFWIEPAFAKKISLADRLNSGSGRHEDGIGRSTITQQHLWRLANSAWWGLLMEWMDRYNFSFGVEVRHPFFDRRLVEFCLSLPEEQRWRRNEMRYVHRSVMIGILPEVVRTRRNKGDFTGLLVGHLLKPEVRRTLESLQLASCGYLNQAGVSRMYAQFQSDSEAGCNFPRFESQLTLIYGVETWLRGHASLNV